MGSHKSVWRSSFIFHLAFVLIVHIVFDLTAFDLSVPVEIRFYFINDVISAYDAILWFNVAALESVQRTYVH